MVNCKPKVEIPSGDSIFDLGIFSTPKTRTSIVDTLTQNGFALDTSFTYNDDNGKRITNSKDEKLGTISGVLLPCLQNILGVILFLRLPFITAQAGCIGTSLIVLICVTSTFLTSLSLSAIATNGKIKAGGPYYVISRNLGVEIGGALGVLFYLGTTVAASMYVLGAIEALQNGFNLNGLFDFDTQILSLVLMFFLAIIVSVGVKYVNMGASLFLGIVLVSILCLIIGVILFSMNIGFNGNLSDDDRVFGDNWKSNYSEDHETKKVPSFFSLLSLFYPSVTGIMAGSNRSSLLIDPSRSIPKGTIGAICITTAIYLSVVWLFGCFISNEALKNNKLIVTAVTYPHDLVVKVGIIVSCVGAALQCLAGAPRILAAIAADETIPFLKYFVPVSPSAEPTRAVWLTWLIASAPTLAGNLDFVTPIITMFFLLMYSGCNMTCFFLSIIRSPNFRPTFSYFHWSVSLLGSIWCLGLAFIISWSTAIGAIFLCVVLVFYIKSQDIVADWGDIWQGFFFNCASLSLKALEYGDKIHAKNWRPQIMTILDITEGLNKVNWGLLMFASHLKNGNGLSIVTGVINGEWLDESFQDKLIDASNIVSTKTIENKMDAFVNIVLANSRPYETLWNTIFTHGLGKMSANAILLSYPESDHCCKERRESVFLTLAAITNMKKAILMLKGNYDAMKNSTISSKATIDIWWLVFDGGLLLLIPFLLSKGGFWKGSRLRLFAVITSSVGSREALESAIKSHLQGIRISAEVNIVDFSFARHDISDTLREDHSMDAPTPRTRKNATSKAKLLLSPKKADIIPTIKNQTVEEVFVGRNALFVAKDDMNEGYESTISARRNASKLLNTELKRLSSASNLVILNLPLTKAFEGSSNYFSYLDNVGDGLNNILFVRGSGEEIITTFG